MLKKHFITTPIFFVVFLIASAQQNILSPQAEISVITIGPGNSLNDAFGHNAFRIKDNNLNLDKTFDYGLFDYNAPNFYLNFARGKLEYALGKGTYYNLLARYINADREIKEQVLNLSQDEKQRLYSFLINNYKPENRNYLYEFFFDNCATKIRDVLQITLKNNINFKTPDNFKIKKFRQLIHQNLNRNSWGCFGIDIALGSVIDRKATATEHMFLPENIFAFFEKATIKTTGKNLVKQTNIIYKQKKESKPSNFITTPLMVLGVISLLIIYITYTDFKKNKKSIWLDSILFAITGLVGILVLLLWFATDHSGTHNNYNLLWAFPINLLVMHQVLKKQASLWFIKYLKFLIILLCLLTLHWIMGVQIFAIGLTPFLIALCTRYIYLIKYFSSNNS